MPSRVKINGKFYHKKISFTLKSKAKAYAKKMKYRSPKMSIRVMPFVFAGKKRHGVYYR